MPRSQKEVVDEGSGDKEGGNSARITTRSRTNKKKKQNDDDEVSGGDQVGGEDGEAEGGLKKPNKKSGNTTKSNRKLPTNQKMFDDSDVQKKRASVEKEDGLSAHGSAAPPPKRTRRRYGSAAVNKKVANTESESKSGDEAIPFQLRDYDELHSDDSDKDQTEDEESEDGKSSDAEESEDEDSSHAKESNDKDKSDSSSEEESDDETKTVAASNVRGRGSPDNSESEGDQEGEDELSCEDEKMDLDRFLSTITPAEKPEVVKFLLNHRKSKKYRIRRMPATAGIRTMKKRAMAKLGGPSRVKYLKNQFKNFIRVEVFKDVKFPVTEKTAKKICRRAARTLKHDKPDDYVEAFYRTLNREINTLRSQTQTLMRMNVQKDIGLRKQKGYEYKVPGGKDYQIKDFPAGLMTFYRRYLDKNMKLKKGRQMYYSFFDYFVKRLLSAVNASHTQMGEGGPGRSNRLKFATSDSFSVTDEGLALLMVENYWNRWLLQLKHPEDKKTQWKDPKYDAKYTSSSQGNKAGCWDDKGRGRFKELCTMVENLRKDDRTCSQLEEYWRRGYARSHGIDLLDGRGFLTTALGGEKKRKRLDDDDSSDEGDEEELDYIGSGVLEMLDENSNELPGVAPGPEK